MAIYIRCLYCKKAALREDRDAFIAKHKESCNEPRFRTFEVEDAAPKKKKIEKPEKKETEKEKAKSFSTKKKFSSKKKS